MVVGQAEGESKITTTSVYFRVTRSSIANFFVNSFNFVRYKTRKTTLRNFPFIVTLKFIKIYSSLESLNQNSVNIAASRALVFASRAFSEISLSRNSLQNVIFGLASPSSVVKSNMNTYSPFKVSSFNNTATEVSFVVKNMQDKMRGHSIKVELNELT